MSFLEVRDLCLDVGGFELDRIKLKAEEGDYLTLIGPTGSGKSLFLETIIGFYSPKKGRIILEGKDITDLPPNMRQISIVCQDHMLFPHMNVFENIAYAIRKKIRDKKTDRSRSKADCRSPWNRGVAIQKTSYPDRRRETEDSHCKEPCSKTKAAPSRRTF